MLPLVTPRLVIRDHCPGDAPAMNRLLSDPVAMRYLPELRTEGMAGTAENLRQALAENGRADRRKWFFAITRRMDEAAGESAASLADGGSSMPSVAGAYIGEIGYTLTESTPEGCVAHFGWFILPQWQGKGIVTEAAREVMRFAFEEGGVAKAETGCLAENRASEAVMRKLGMVREALLVRHTAHEGVLKDRVEYRLLREEWEAVRHADSAGEMAGEAPLLSLKCQPAMMPAIPKPLECAAATMPPQSMRLPKAIFFDFGQTLLDEQGFDPVRGTAAVLAEAVHNPRGATAEQVQALADAMLLDIGRRGVPPEGQTPLEVHSHVFNRYLYESFGIAFTQPQEVVERIFWDAAAPAVLTPGIGALLASLAARGIRTGVVSNISFSGRALEERLRRHLPEHAFDFVLASSEYVFRKPHPRIFALALGKLGVSPDEAWFCGDHPYFDIEGAAAAGMTPVWYTACLHREHAAYPGAGTREPQVPCVRIGHWDELRFLIEKDIMAG